MRILMISHTCQSKTEGQPKAECLAAIDGIELCVLSPDRWNNYGVWRTAEMPAAAGYIYRAGKVRWPWVGPAGFYLHHYPELSQVLKEFRPDIIDLWEEPWGLVSAQAVYLRNKLLPSAKILVESEQNIDKRLPFPFERFRSYTLRNANFALGRNVEAVKVLRTKGYCGATAVVPNGVDAQLFRPMDRAVCRAELGLQGFVVGYVGRIVEMKGLTDLVESLQYVPQQANLLLVGSGPFLPELQQFVCAQGREAQVRFIPARPLESLPQIMNGLDVLTLVSRTTARSVEQFGRVLIEAGACGIPVIGSSSGAIPSVVGAGGLIAKERDPHSIAQAICKLMESPDLCRELGETGRKNVADNYTWDRIAERMVEVYRQMLN